MKKNSRRGPKRGTKISKKKRKKEKGREEEEEEDETHSYFPPIEFILIHFLRRASFCRLHQKLSKTAKIIINNNERSNFVTHRPSRDPNRELVLGTVLFRCVGLLFFF